MHTAPPRPVRHLTLHAVADKHDEEQRLGVMYLINAVVFP